MKTWTVSGYEYDIMDEDFNNMPHEIEKNAVFILREDHEAAMALKDEELKSLTAKSIKLFSAAFKVWDFGLGVNTEKGGVVTNTEAVLEEALTEIQPLLQSALQRLAKG